MALCLHSLATAAGSDGWRGSCGIVHLFCEWWTVARRVELRPRVQQSSTELVTAEDGTEMKVPAMKELQSNSIGFTESQRTWSSWPEGNGTCHNSVLETRRWLHIFDTNGSPTWTRGRWYHVLLVKFTQNKHVHCVHLLKYNKRSKFIGIWPKFRAYFGWIFIKIYGSYFIKTKWYFAPKVSVMCSIWTQWTCLVCGLIFQKIPFSSVNKISQCISTYFKKNLNSANLIFLSTGMVSCWRIASQSCNDEYTYIILL